MEPTNRPVSPLGPEYVYSWGPRWKFWPTDHPLKQLDRKGQRCTVLARGAMNSAIVQFGDGETAIVSRNALRKTNNDHDQKEAEAV